MREIKFKIEIDGEWIPLTLNEMLEYAEQGNDIIKDCIKRQYTGLKDKNGVEIYEGDIVQYIPFENGNRDYGHMIDIFEVFYSQKVCAFVFKHNNQKISYKNIQEVCIDNHYMDRIEVIGNIYETPELLHVKAKDA